MPILHSSSVRSTSVSDFLPAPVTEAVPSLLCTAVSQSLKELTQAVEDYQTHVTLLNKNGSSRVSEHFKKLFRQWGNKPRMFTPPPPTLNDVEALWQAFKGKSSPTPPEEVRMLREGLSNTALLEHPDFIVWLQKWNYSQRLCFRWLHTYVWHEILLQREIRYNTAALDSVFALYNRVITNYSDLLRLDKTHPQAWKRFYQAYQTQTLTTVFSDSIEATLAELMASSTPLSEAPAWLCHSFQTQYGLLTPLPFTHPLINHVLGQYFDVALKQYQGTTPPKTTALQQLLDTFCEQLLHDPIARERLVKLWHTLGFATGTHTAEERRCLQAFCQTKLEDPRLAPANWLALKHLDATMHQTLLFWFNEADFNLFFEFVFKGAVDPHGRKDCWKRYLKDAVGFRIFLPRYEMKNFNQFIREKREKEKTTFLKPIVNEAGLTSFLILLSNQILIFETKETGNASYVYDLKALENDPYFNSKKVLKTATLFHDETIESFPLKAMLAHTELAPDGKNNTFFSKTQRHWRFTHDNTYKWHESVRMCMKQVYGIDPKETKG